MGVVVVGHHVGRHHAAVLQDVLRLVGLHDEVADGEHEAVFADRNAITAALGAQVGNGVAVGWNFRAHQHHRIERARQVELRFAGLRLQRFLKGPFL